MNASRQIPEIDEITVIEIIDHHNQLQIKI